MASLAKMSTQMECLHLLSLKKILKKFTVLYWFKIQVILCGVSDIVYRKYVEKIFDIAVLNTLEVEKRINPHIIYRG